MIWKLFVELRKELLEAQKIRAQMVGVKVTFVTAVMGILSANIEKIDKALFVIPAFAAIFFDYIIYSYSFSIKRIGSYTRKHIEPALELSSEIPENFIMWQKFLTQPETRQNLALYGNLGVTVLMVGIAVIAQFFPFRPLLSTTLIVTLAIFVVMDAKAYREPSKFGNQSDE